MKKVIVITILVLTAAVIAYAQHPRPSDEEVAAILNLTPDQQSAWKAMHAAFNADNAALFDSERSLGQQIEATLRSATPDACALGNLMMQQKSVRDQLKTAHEALVQKLSAILTPEQKTKLQTVLTMHQMHERVQGPRP